MNGLTGAPPVGLPDGIAGYAFILALAVFVHEPWRWLGALIGRNIEIGSPVFQWVRAVATALVAALVMRLLLFPAGALGHLPVGLRVAAFATGIVVFFASGRRMAPGVMAAAVALVVGAAIVA